MRAETGFFTFSILPGCMLPGGKGGGGSPPPPCAPAFGGMPIEGGMAAIVPGGGTGGKPGGGMPAEYASKS